MSKKLTTEALLKLAEENINRAQEHLREAERLFKEMIEYDKG